MRIARALVIAALAATALAQEPARDRAFGMVRTADGEPWAGATVHLLHRAYPGVLDRAHEDHVVTESDAGGRFKVELLAGMPYAVWAQGPVEDGSFRCTAVLPDVVPGVPIVLDEGAPRFVRRVALDLHESWTAPVRIVASTTVGSFPLFADLAADDDGGVATPPWPGEFCSIHAYEGDHRVFTTWVVTSTARAERSGPHRGVGADEVDDVEAVLREPLRISVPPRTEIPVRFVDDATGAPVASVEVRAEGRLPRPVLGTTGEDGVLRIVTAGSVLGAVPYRSVALATEHAENELGREDIQETPEGQVAEKRLFAGRPVRARLFLGEDEPAADLPVVLQGSIWLGGGTTWFGVNPRVLRTGADGALVVPGRVQSHPFRLSVVLSPAQRARLASGADAPPLWPLALVAAEHTGELADLGDVRLDRLRPVDVRVLAPDGAPPGSAQVLVVPLCAGQARSLPHEPDVVRTDRHGRMRVLVHPEAELLVHTTTADGAAWRIIDADRTAADLTIDPAHVVRFRVVDGEGEPVGGCHVSLVVPDALLTQNGEDRLIHARVRDLCMVNAFPRKSGRTDGDGLITLIMPMVEVSLDLSIDHRARGLSARVSIPFPREREDGPIELTVVGK